MIDGGRGRGEGRGRGHCCDSGGECGCKDNGARVFTVIETITSNKCWDKFAKPE